MNQKNNPKTKSKETTKSRFQRNRHIFLIFAGLMTAMLLSSLNQTILSTALPTIVGELSGVDQMMWVMTGYILAVTIMLPVYGKLGDLIGRKQLFIGAIALFMVGSIVGGFAPDMNWLIASRVIQGLGGGGLMILAQAIIADVVPARERGKYMGIMGGVFAFSSVAGPLLGGWFTESIGWRWVFWMNIPLGILAILSAAFFLKLPKPVRNRPKIDVAGMMLLAIASASIVLTTTWGGHTYEWGSAVINSLIALFIVATLLFVAVERRAKEPVMPLSFFKERNFVLTTGAGLIIGIAMFGALGYLPTYLQMVTGVGVTEAGLLMIPMMAALLVSSIVTGQLVSRTGKYKWFPVIGSVVVMGALRLLSTMTPELPVWQLCSYLAIMGLGLGMSMQILVLVVQNTFPLSHVGTATASNNYFRQIGASLGASLVGSVFTSRLIELLHERLPRLGTAPDKSNSFTPDIVNNLPAPIHDIVISSYNDALTPIFLYMIPLVGVAVVLLCFVKEKPLATTIKRDIVPESLEIDGAEHVRLR